MCYIPVHVKLWSLLLTFLLKTNAETGALKVIKVSDAQSFLARRSGLVLKVSPHIQTKSMPKIF